MHLPVRFRPLYQTRVWGGRILGDLFGREVPSTEPIGESWEIVDRRDAQSVIRDGPLAGFTLREAMHVRCADWMGPVWPVNRPFPILVKWLDCRERLSLQVHPPAEAATKLAGEPKTENWYLVDTRPEAGLFLGLRPGVTRPEFEAAIAKQTLESCLNRVAVKAGDSVLVRSGTLHAIDAGCVLLEIQQNSDTTYRVYDWGRRGLDGLPRQMHVAQALRSISFEDPPPKVVPDGPGAAVIAACLEFRIRRVPIRVGGTPLVFGAGEQCRILSVVRGRLRGRGLDLEPFVAGENVLLPFAGSFSFDVEADGVVLVTENFT